MCLYDPLDRNTILIDCLLLIKKIEIFLCRVNENKDGTKKNMFIFGAKFLLPAF